MSKRKSYDVCSGTCCQVFDPAKVTEAAIDATADIFITQSSGKTASSILLYYYTGCTVENCTLK